MPTVQISDGFSETLKHLPHGEFSTADFVVAYRNYHAEEWKVIEAKHGVGGRGAGQHYTVFSHVARRLSKLAREGKVEKLNYRIGPGWWGNPDVQYWSHGQTSPSNPKPDEAADSEFREGSLQLKTHLRRERAWGLASKKRADFRTKHGKLMCERCNLDPEAEFGAKIGNAVIEVHHAATAVGTMKPGHRTKLSDLQCLCANCHRLVHAEINQQAAKK